MEKDSEITRAFKEMQERVKAPKEAGRAHNNMKKKAKSKKVSQQSIFTEYN